MFVFYFMCICAPLAVMNCTNVLHYNGILGFTFKNTIFFLTLFFDAIVWHIILIAFDPDIDDSQNLHAFLGEGMEVYLLAEYSIRLSGHSDEFPEYQYGCAYSTSQ